MHFLHKHPLLCADLFWGCGSPARFVNPTTTSPNPSKSKPPPKLLPALPLPLQHNPQNSSQPAKTSGGCCASTCLRYLPVWLVECSATSSGVPATTISPPLSPPSGPRSMIQSAQRITSRLCSITPITPTQDPLVPLLFSNKNSQQLQQQVLLWQIKVLYFYKAKLEHILKD